MADGALDLSEAIMLVGSYMVYIVVTLFYTKTLAEWVTRVEVYFEYTDPNKVRVRICAPPPPSELS